MASAARAEELFCSATNLYLSELERYGRWPPAAQLVPEAVPDGGAFNPIRQTRIFLVAFMLCSRPLVRFARYLLNRMRGMDAPMPKKRQCMHRTTSDAVARIYKRCINTFTSLSST